MALAYAALGVAFVVTVVRSGDRFGAWTLLLGCALWAVLGWRWARRANAAQVLDLQAELTAERDEVGRLKDELAEQHRTITEAKKAAVRARYGARWHAGGGA